MFPEKSYEALLMSQNASFKTYHKMYQSKSQKTLNLSQTELEEILNLSQTELEKIAKMRSIKNYKKKKKKKKNLIKNLLITNLNQSKALQKQRRLKSLKNILKNQKKKL